ncbi:hypothetical protein ES319_A11G056200v1 [Gossypium barbadense]|uniref:Myb-like domain-containing protein n=2 Tax=Gossypium TaxID=3633 RepID=A0A5J5TMD4_GOSBA|nr:hypothetical protein ES319_A11G056200v1 [Gossypium barbadense]TYG92777.1 hypothetical protein ES288_A11G058700v1 [Gossypium darwinii]
MLTRNSVPRTPQPTAMRRSARLLNQKTPIKSEANSKESTASSAVKLSKKPIQSSHGSTNRDRSTPQLRRSQRTSTVSSEISINCSNSTPGLRKSPRLSSGSLSNKPEDRKFVETKNDGSKENESIKEGSLDEKEREASVGLKVTTVDRKESERREVRERNEVVGVKRKRKRKPDNREDTVIQGWTREQELALQRAYFSAKPTANFWKKVSKLVPGKSAQDCFDRIHSNHLTPTQPEPRSRANVTNLSPIEHLSFSASKLLESSAPRNKSSGRGKQKSFLVQKKTVRHLLRKHHLVDECDEADLFSILEPNTSPTMRGVPKVMVCTPKKLLEKQGFVHKCHERSSSGRKKHHSRLGNSGTGALVSPPVLKQIKNKALHEKYIDQLHTREAKRKAERTQVEKAVLGKENRGYVQIQVDKVKAAKNALVSDARYVINQMQQLQTTSVDNSLELDDIDDDEDEDDVKL